MEVIDWRAKPESFWREKLTPEQYRVLREGGTEAPGTGGLCYIFDPGEYACGACGTPLFRAGEKFESTSGWPSFFAPRDDSLLALVEDKSLGMSRTEVRCNTCGSHLGHVFDDGPPPTGTRYCINSAALTFSAATQEN